MAKKIDLATVTPEKAARLLQQREQKRRAYQLRKQELLARNAAWREANPEKTRAYSAKWRAANPERAAAAKRDWYEKNRDLQLRRAAERNKNLVDSVVKGRYCGKTPLQSKDIPDELVPLIRTSILVKKAIKEQRHELRRTDN